MTGEVTLPEPPLFELHDVGVSYNGVPAIEGVTLEVARNQITAFIGPSGCGKTSILRVLNRMNDLTPEATVDGTVLYHGIDLYERGIDPIEVRKRIGMVFQKPNPFPKSIFENVAFGPKLYGTKKGPELDGTVEHALKRAALWDEVKSKLGQSAFTLSGGQQQRLCIARTLAVDPDVVLMDEPCSALDPIATGKIEDLMKQLTEDCSVIIVTHNMQQASRTSDATAFFTAELDDSGRVAGKLIEYAATKDIFTNPQDERTEAYVTGQFG